MKNLLLSAYFTSGQDPQRGTFWKSDDFSVMREWYWSARHYLDCDMAVIHDGLSPAFINGINDVQWVFCNAKQGAVINNKSLNDIRFFYWRNIVAKMTHKRVLITDIADVEFYKDPFKFMTDQDALYIGSNDTWGQKPKFHEKLLKAVSAEQADTIMQMPLINPGIIGGDVRVVLPFLGNMCKALGRFRRDENMNMIIANKLAYFGGYKIITGHPLHTRFKSYEDSTSKAYVRHK